MTLNHSGAVECQNSIDIVNNNPGVEAMHGGVVVVGRVDRRTCSVCSQEMMFPIAVLSETW